jgi:ATP-binding protein involved in chromosome partitioning
MTVTDAELIDRLAEIEDPLNDEDIVSLELVNEVSIVEGTATVDLAFNDPFAPTEIEVGNAIRDAVEDLGLTPNLTASVNQAGDAGGGVLPGVRSVIAVASAKGGVGKTTIAANLAAGLAEVGARVGLLDADIHGPNAPSLLPTSDQPGTTPSGDIVPPDSDGVRVMSTEFLMPEEGDEPAVLRGPMVNNVMMKFLNEVEWGHRDYLVVDLPPGTGDASINLLQTLPVAGAVLVTTPQEMAVADARKSLKLFEEHDAPIIGVVENMSRFHCPTCEDDHDPFGSGGAEEICADYDVPLLAELPVHRDFDSNRTDGPAVRASSTPLRESLLELSEEVADRLGAINRRRLDRDGRGR